MNIHHLAFNTIHYLRTASQLSTDEAEKNILNTFVSEIEFNLTEELKKQVWNVEPVRGLIHLPFVFESINLELSHNKLRESAIKSISDAHWTEFYTETEWTRDFLPHFTTGDCIGPSGRYVSNRIILGLFILGPNVYYPPHAHPAEEFYLVVSGHANFKVGSDSPFQQKTAGDVILHKSNVSHAIQTTTTPLFAIYGWRGDLDKPTWYRDEMSDESLPLKYPPFSKATRLKKNF